MKMCFIIFACGWTFQASHAKMIKKFTPTPTPQLNFVERCQNRSQTFFLLLNIARGGRGIFIIFACEAGIFRRQFHVFGTFIFHEKTCLKKFCVIFYQNLWFWKIWFFLWKCSNTFFRTSKNHHRKKNMFFASKCVTLLMPSLGNGRKNKVTPRRIVKTNARVSLLKFNQTCVQKSVFGKSMCTFLQCRTLCFRHKKCSFCQSKTDKQQASIVVFEFLAAKWNTMVATISKFCDSWHRRSRPEAGLRPAASGRAEAGLRPASARLPP